MGIKITLLRHRHTQNKNIMVQAQTTKAQFKDELIATAKAICAPGKGILAADESTGTIGSRFAKWRAVLKIGNGCPSMVSVRETAHTLARYGSICQDNGLVPIIEPEILTDGSHTIEECASISELVFRTVMQAMLDQDLIIEGTLLKPNMVTAGSTCEDQGTPEKIAWLTVRTLSRSIVPALPGVVFLSGGQSEEAASVNLNAMNKL